MLMAAITAVEPERLVADRLSRSPALVGPGSVVVLALGKAAAGMARGAVRVLQGRTRGIAVAPERSAVSGIEVVTGDHPIPGPNSFAAGERLLGMARTTGPDDVVLVLVSGGASAMAEVAAPGISQRDIAQHTTDLLASGRPIHEMNAARTAMSLLKGGGLAAAARPARVVTLAISDVIDSDPATIGSGPSVGSDVFEVIADGAAAAAAAAEVAAAEGLTAQLRGEPIAGPARQFGRRIGRLASALPAGSAIVGFGETTVRLVGGGRGGRNQETALAAALELDGSDAVVGSLGTDGVDGPTRNAGAIVDGSTVHRGGVLGLDAEDHLTRHDSATYLEAVGDVVVTGPTGTNVGDVIVALRV